ncbi:hypothetical protein BOTBODRAFT_592935 [Botryobasidium botryosum FD-172 SS1]|uniref:Uncharacterized protein n=1 Tax=Botryobasidium botryosum (strain FD-172 SS1) TaxID=930990 RepID=A0A067LWW6_BOTB1|nr:hypothetical protein BOTBODRAFT_592935 [Botryobasidium botryosum FD-172 SS1]
MRPITTPSSTPLSKWAELICIASTSTGFIIISSCVSPPTVDSTPCGRLERSTGIGESTILPRFAAYPMARGPCSILLR